MLQSSPFARISAAAVPTPAGAPPADGFYATSSSVVGSSFGTGLSQCVMLGKQNGGRDRGVEVMLFSDETEDDDIVVHLYAIEIIAGTIKDGAGVSGYAVRKVCTVTATVGATEVDAVVGLDDTATHLWVDTLASVTLTDYGTALLAAVGIDSADFAAGFYSPGSDGMASFFVPDLGGAFALGLAPATGSIGMVARRMT